LKGERFESGASINNVAEELFKRNWAAAKKLHDELYPAKRKAPRKPEPEETVESDPDVWDLTLQVPTAQMDQILMRFTLQEKADAISTVLQARLGAA
jgi:hypothetical protein